MLLARAQGIGLDADALAFIARNGQAPTVEQKAIYVYCAQQLKSIGVWTYLTDFGFLCAQDSATAKLGFKNVINLSNVGAGPTHFPGFGMQANGSTTALDTNYKIPSGSQDNASMGLYCLSRGQEDAAMMGNANCVITPRHLTSADVAFVRMNGASSGQFAGSVDPIGLLIANRLGPLAADGTLWKHGSKLTLSTPQGASQTPDATYSIRILGRNGASPEYSTKIGAFWFIGAGIPEALIPAFDALIDDVVAMLTASVTVLASMTAETKSVFRYLVKMGRRPDYLLGAFDNTFWGLGTTPNLIDDILTLTGKVPTFVHRNWVDPLSTNGAVNAAAQLQRIKDHYAAGGITYLFHQSGNPVTGTFYQDVTAQSPPTTGNSYDQNGAPVAACLSAGSKRTDFLAYIDRIITFLNSCIGADGKKIPIVLRLFHEVNGNFFWWTDSGTPANSKQLFKDMVDRIKAAGVTNVIFDFNRDIGAASTVDTTYYPGDGYCDFVSGDYYDNNTDTASVPGLSSAVTKFNSLRTGVAKPMWMGENGYQYAGSAVADIWSTKTGFYHRDRFSLSAVLGIWRSPYGPKVGDTSAAGFQAMVAESHCITRDLATAYTFTQALET